MGGRRQTLTMEWTQCAPSWPLPPSSPPDRREGAARKRRHAMQSVTRSTRARSSQVKASNGRACRPLHVPSDSSQTRCCQTIGNAANPYKSLRRCCYQVLLLLCVRPHKRPPGHPARLSRHAMLSSHRSPRRSAPSVGWRRTPCQRWFHSPRQEARPSPALHGLAGRGPPHELPVVAVRHQRLRKPAQQVPTSTQRHALCPPGPPAAWLPPVRGAPPQPPRAQDTHQ